MEKEGDTEEWRKATNSGPKKTEQSDDTKEQNLLPKSKKNPFPWTTLIIVTVICLVVAILMLIEASQ